jgi:hypothetical protein
MDERLMDNIIEDFVVAVHRRHVDIRDVHETAKRIFTVATLLDWTEEIAADIEDLKRRLPEGWEGRFGEASAKAKRLCGARDPAGAATVLRDVVEEIAKAARWRPLAFFSYDDLINPDLLSKNFQDRKELTERYSQLTESNIGEALDWAQRLHDRLSR